MGEIEPELAIGHFRPCLRRMRTEDLSEGGMKEMGRCMVPLDPPPPGDIDRKPAGIPDLKPTFSDLDVVNRRPAVSLPRIADDPLPRTG